MVSAKILDFNQPDTAKAVGGELAVTTRTLVDRLAVTAITDTASLERAVRDRQDIGEALKRITDFFEPLKSMAHRLHKALCDRETEICAPIRALDAQKRIAIADYKAAQDLARQARERELAAERQREAQDRAAAEAAHLEDAGEPAMAAAVMEEAIAAAPPVVVLADPTAAVEGLKFVRRWLWRYAGGPKEIKLTPPTVVARTMQLIPREYLCVDEKKVGAYVRSMKATGSIPGIEIYYVDDPVR
jgi:hypothetical protein